MMMRVNMVGALRQAADALDAYDARLGGEDAEDENADERSQFRPGLYSYVLREMADNAALVEGDPALLEEFARLYCLKKKPVPPAPSK